MKSHDEKSYQSKRGTKLPVPRKKVRIVPEKVTPGTEVQKPYGMSHTKEVMRAPEHAITETQKADRAELAEIGKLICEASGIRGKRPAERMLAQMELMQIWRLKDADAGESALGALEMMVELKPANVVEAMLTVQMVGVHEAALMFLKRATTEGQSFDGRDANTLRATRLLRLFNEQLEAMAKLKGKAGQKVTVEHVHVYQGGQAIVGAVTAGKEGPGEGRDDETRRNTP